MPRPWLGGKGEAIAALKLDQIVNHGWEMKRAADLAGKHRGIMLTSIVPGSPAAQAELRAGDVILKVDEKDIQNEADFTWWLDQAGPSSSVRFTVARPDRPVEQAVRAVRPGGHVFVGNGKGTGFANSSMVVDNSGRAPNMPTPRLTVISPSS